MNYLLDTHVVFWVLVDDVRLPVPYRDVLTAGNHQFWVSAVTGWEIATKVRIGKWPEAQVLLPDLFTKVRLAGFKIAELTLEQAERAGSFPGGHKDPFDRLLAAQAIDREFTVLTVDPALASLGCKVA